jgi:hypothetical protein
MIDVTERVEVNWAIEHLPSLDTRDLRPRDTAARELVATA